MTYKVATIQYCYCERKWLLRVIEDFKQLVGDLHTEVVYNGNADTGGRDRFAVINVESRKDCFKVICNKYWIV